MKQALVMISFGTSVPEARGSIAAVERVLEEAACGYTAVRAFTSPTIRRILAGRGEDVPSLTGALEQLCQAGARRVAVQPTHLLYGYEYDKLKAEAEAFSDRFEQLAVGRPLLAGSRDILRFAEQLAAARPWQAGTAVVCMGHGTEHFANAAYPALQTALRLSGREDILIGTVEGWPGLEDVLRQLRAPCAVQLLPLMLVAGDHARNDMSVAWKGALERAGHRVRCGFTGLGELAWVQDMYREKVLETLEQAGQ